MDLSYLDGLFDLVWLRGSRQLDRDLPRRQLPRGGAGAGSTAQRSVLTCRLDVRTHWQTVAVGGGASTRHLITGVRSFLVRLLPGVSYNSDPVLYSASCAVVDWPYLGGNAFV